jgi:hypothetical protein
MKNITLTQAEITTLCNMLYNDIAEFMKIGKEYPHSYRVMLERAKERQELGDKFYTELDENYKDDVNKFKRI